MNPAVTRRQFLPVLVALLSLASSLNAASAISARAAPNRPSPVPVTKLSGIEFVKLSDVAHYFNYTGSWVTKGKIYRLASGGTKAEFNAGSREVLLDGARVFLGNPTELRSGVIYVSKIDFERTLTGLLKPSLVEPRVPRPQVIVIDAGHGGDDPGKENTALKLQEKDLTLDICLRLEPLLKAAGFKVVLTRRDDRRLVPFNQQADLRRRSEIANTSAADLFVSVHLNAEDKPSTVGSEVYTFTLQNQRTSNAWSLGAKDDAQPDPAIVNRYDAWSAALAHAVHRELLSGLKSSDRGQKNNHLGVLRGLECPGILVEAAFLSNDTEARRVATPQNRQQIAEAIAAGINRYASLVESASPSVGKK